MVKNVYLRLIISNHMLIDRIDNQPIFGLSKSEAGGEWEEGLMQTGGTDPDLVSPSGMVETPRLEAKFFLR